MDQSDQRKIYLQTQNKNFKKLYAAFINDEIIIEQQSIQVLYSYIADVSLDQTKYCYLYQMIFQIIEDKQYRICDYWHLKHAQTVSNFTHDSYVKTLSNKEQEKIKKAYYQWNYEAKLKRRKNEYKSRLPPRPKDGWFIKKWKKFWGFFENCCSSLKNMFSNSDQISEEQFYNSNYTTG